MKQQLQKYPNMHLVSTVYGNDDPATSLTVLQGLLSAYPNLRGIISPTTVGISTAAQYLDTHKSLLSKLDADRARTAVADEAVRPGRHRQGSSSCGTRSDLGYLAGYAAASLASGTTTLDTGATFKAGKLGSYTVLAPAGTTGPSVVLGPPTVFDKSNVDQFNF